VNKIIVEFESFCKGSCCIFLDSQDESAYLRTLKNKLQIPVISEDVGSMRMSLSVTAQNKNQQVIHWTSITH